MSLFIEDKDYYMGLALMSASRTDNGKSILLVDNFDNFTICTGDNENIIEPECFLAATSKNSYASAFFTYTPNVKSVKLLSITGVKKIIFFQTSSIEDDVVSVSSSMEIELENFNGNIHWMRDYIFFMRSKDIL